MSTKTTAKSAEPYAPGSIYTTEVVYELANGEIAGDWRGLIVWRSAPDPSIPVPKRVRTGETPWRLLVTWATDEFHVHSKPRTSTGRPFEIIQWSHGWEPADPNDCFHGRLGGHVGSYKPADPGANSVEIMAAAHEKQLHEQQQWRANNPSRTLMWPAAMVCDYLGIKGSTWRAYVANGDAPAPDEVRGGRNYWYPRTIRTWDDNRPGSGARTDLAQPSAE
ncbi:helix-turn-helix transcriptional regulator [Saccharothrix hoggarensis]|uniref:Helix-turn-helix transcriptional regulator n=1 Tax=Saccharothrix hoggarensis TaxID=913853 RepID=A0ABW3QFQ7_9PSEU